MTVKIGFDSRGRNTGMEAAGNYVGELLDFEVAEQTSETMPGVDICLVKPEVHKVHPPLECPWPPPIIEFVLQKDEEGNWQYVKANLITGSP